MATLYSSDGAHTGDGINIALAEVDAKLRARGHTPKDFTHTAGDNAPQFQPVTKWREYLLLRVYETEEKTALFPKSGFYHLRGLTVRDTHFLLEAEDDPP
jgi:hypothetical protein